MHNLGITMAGQSRFAFYNRDDDRGGGRCPVRTGPPVPDPPPPPPVHPVGISSPIGQVPMQNIQP